MSIYSPRQPGRRSPPCFSGPGEIDPAGRGLVIGDERGGFDGPKSRIEWPDGRPPLDSPPHFSYPKSSVVTND